MPDSEPGANAAALEELLPGADGADAALVQAARSLAALVDRRPADAALWGRYLAALGELRKQVTETEDQAFLEALAQIRGAGPS